MNPYGLKSRNSYIVAFYYALVDFTEKDSSHIQQFLTTDDLTEEYFINTLSKSDLDILLQALKRKYLKRIPGIEHDISRALFEEELIEMVQMKLNF